MLRRTMNKPPNNRTQTAAMNNPMETKQPERTNRKKSRGEKWTVRLGEGIRRIMSLMDGTRCLLRVGAKVKESDLQRIADAHNASIGADAEERIQQLEAACAVKDEALREVRKTLLGHQEYYFNLIDRALFPISAPSLMRWSLNNLMETKQPEQTNQNGGSRSDVVSGYALSDAAQHAVGAAHYALLLGDPTMTAEELRYYIRRIYGAEVDAHLKRHFAHNVGT